jgi:ATP-dependent RNA helicase DDX46/PRP5
MSKAPYDPKIGDSRHFRHPMSSNLLLEKNYSEPNKQFPVYKICLSTFRSLERLLQEFSEDVQWLIIISMSSSSNNSSRSRSRHDGWRRKDRRGGRRRKDSGGEEDRAEREQRKKQERLAKLRAMAYDDEAEARKAKLTVQQMEKTPRPFVPVSGPLVPSGADGIRADGTIGADKGQITEADSERYGTLDDQNAAIGGQPTNADKLTRLGLLDDLDGEEGASHGPLLTEEEIREAKLLLKRDWRRKKQVERRGSSDEEEESDDDDLGGIFKTNFGSYKPKENQQVIVKDHKPIEILTVSLTDKDIELEREIEEEQEKIREAETRGEDTLEAYMKGIESKAVKQETYNMAQRLQKQKERMLGVNQEEDEVIGSNLVATMDNIQMVGEHESDGKEKMDEEATEEPDDDPQAQEFIQALKDLDRLKETEGEQAIQNEVDDKPEIFSNPDADAFEIDDDMSEEEDVKVDYFAKRDKLAEKRVLKPVNHAEINYEPFRKNLYIECEDITTKSEAEIEYFRRELGDIKIRGIDCPRPIQNWYQCGLSDKILKVLIEKSKFERPFAIQCQAIPAIMSGRDCIGIAETGSGKTLAFVLPMLRHIMDQRRLIEGEGPIAIIMVPTRELANQVYNDTKPFCRLLGINAVSIYGGGMVAGQLSDLKRGCEVVICTPGRMIDVLTTSNGKITNLKRTTYVVLDEADRMFDLGFEPQISRILTNVRPDRQTVMFSATFPRNVETLAKKILTKPVEIVVGNRGQVGRNILQIIEVIEPEKKIVKLLEILGYWSSKGQILIFVDKQVEADNLFTELLKYGYNPLVLHGGQDQVDRQFTIADFKRGAKTLMIATSLCARGLDIKNLVLVINYSCPTFKEDYTHRIGRTGRAGNKGTAITFVTPEEDMYSGEIIHALQLSNVDPPEDLRRLNERFMVKVRRGEAKEVRNRNIAGSGYRFSADELVKMKEFKNTMKTEFGIDLGDDNMSMTSRAPTMKTTLTLREEDKKGPKENKEGSRLVKDQKTKDAIRKAATKAATQAIIAGANGEEVLLAAQNAIREILQRLKEGEVIGKGTSLDDLYRARDEMLEKGEGTSGSFSQNFDINDYPESTRKKVCEREFLDMVASLTQCTITVRGSFVEPGRKALIGQKKLHIHVASDDQYNLHAAIDEIKKFTEDSAITSLTATGGYTGYTSRY